MLFPFSLLLLATSVLGQLPVHEAPRLQTRIIGGHSTPAHYLPHQAFIRQQITPAISSDCGAILIDPEWILTAEHCLVSKDITEAPIEVFLGLSRLDQIDRYFDHTDRKRSRELPVKRRVVRYFRGPRVQIGNRTEKTDIMLMKLDHQVTTSWSIKPIELPPDGVRWSNQMAVTSGFGVVKDEDRNLSNTLRYIKLPILSKRDCLAMYREKFPEAYRELRLRVAPETVLCAGYELGGRSGCFGDSGGPLAVCATPLQEIRSGGYIQPQLCKDNRWMLAGVVSGALRGPFGNKCAEPNRPALHANVPLFGDWIRRTMSNN